MPTLYVYISNAHRDMQGAIGTLDHKPGWENAHFQSGMTLIMVNPQEDVRPLNYYRDRIVL